MTRKLIPIILVTIAILTSCAGDKMSEQINTFPSIKDVPSSSWEKLSQKKIYFGHQSVGFNIIDGIKDVMKENPQIKINIVETSGPLELKTGIFAHSRVGQNMNPKSKMKDFVSFIENGIGNEADFAGLKFCYVDVRGDSDIENIFNDYERSILQIKSKFPGIKIIHFTAPLTKIQTGPKVWIKKLIGRTTTTDDNIRRNEYNKMILAKYRDSGSVFDIATIESTLPDGSRSSFNKDRSQYYSMFNGYTYDGGHLNEHGRKFVAEQFLIFLVDLSEK